MIKHATPPPSASTPRGEEEHLFARLSSNPTFASKRKKLPFNKSAYFSLVWRDIPTIFIVPQTTHSSQRPRTGRRLNIIYITHTTTTLQLTPTTYKPLDFSFQRIRHQSKATTQANSTSQERKPLGLVFQITQRVQEQGRFERPTLRSYH